MSSETPDPRKRDWPTASRETWHIEATDEDAAREKAESTVQWIQDGGVNGFVRVVGVSMPESETRDWTAYERDADTQPAEFYDSKPVYEVEFVKTQDIAENADASDIPGCEVPDEQEHTGSEEDA